MKVEETMNDYFLHKLMIVNEIKTNGESKSDIVALEKILWSVSLKFNWRYILYLQPVYRWIIELFTCAWEKNDWLRRRTNFGSNLWETF